MSDRKFWTTYRNWLDQFTNLYDCAFEHGGRWDQWTDDELAEFRNRPKCRNIERRDGRSRYPKTLWSSHFRPKLDDLRTNSEPDLDFTIFGMNRCGSDSVILMLVDIDNRDGGDVDRAVADMIERHGFTSVYVEPSRHGEGRHVYFLLDTSVQGVTFHGSREDIWTAFRQFTHVIQQDAIWNECKVKCDGVFGLPTLWGKLGDQYVVERRGNALKLPRLAKGQADLDRLTKLSPMSFERLLTRLDHVQNRVVTRRTIFRGKSSDLERSQRQPVPTDEDDLTRLNGWQKKVRCVSRMMLATDGTVTLEQCHADYMANYQPSTQGDTTQDERRRLIDLSNVLSKMQQTYRPRQDRRKYPFSRGQFLGVVQKLVPSTAYEWKRREKLNADRLADFISLKIADAFIPKADHEFFGRTSRDTTINNSRKLKAAGKMDWIINGHTYKRLLDIATEHDLLEVFDEHKRPTLAPDGQKVFRGKGRLVGPGKALRAIRDQWLPLYNVCKGNSSRMIDMLAA